MGRDGIRSVEALDGSHGSSIVVVRRAGETRSDRWVLYEVVIMVAIHTARNPAVGSGTGRFDTVTSTVTRSWSRVNRTPMSLPPPGSVGRPRRGRLPDLRRW
jgi:hypothetical protein